MRTGRLALVAAVLVASRDARAQAPVPPSQDDQAVRYGVTKSRDSVTIGEPFEIRVRIRAPADAHDPFSQRIRTLPERCRAAIRASSRRRTA